MLLICWAIPFAFLHVLTHFPDLLSALIAIPIGVILLAIASKMA
jgi:hypothetical protein